MLKDDGFTIVELVVAIVFLGMVSLGISGLYVSISNIQRQSQYTATANRAAQAEIETLRNSNYNQLTAGQTITFTNQLPAGLPQATGTVIVSEPQTGLKRVDVTVSYKPGTQQKNITLSSLIGVIGITK